MVTISALRMTGQGPSRHDRGMDLPAPIAWLVDEAGASPGPDRFLAGHCHGKMVEAAVRRLRAGGSSRGRVLPLLRGVGPEQTHDAAGEEVALE